MKNKLSKERISTYIDNICSNGPLKDEFLDLHGLKIERISDWSPVLAKAKCASNSKEYSHGCTPWHFGLSIFDREGGLVGFVSFNVAYSSWSGRILYMDQIHLDEGYFSDDVDVLLLRLLANLAIKWDCARLTWKASCKLVKICLNGDQETSPVLSATLDYPRVNAVVSA